MRVLAVSVAPGDAEMGCGGTLARVIADGGGVAICTLSSGNSRGGGRSPRDTARDYQAEVGTAASTLGADLIWLGHSDFGVSNDSVTRIQIVDVLRKFRPDAVLAPASVDTDHDRRDGWRLAVDAAQMAASSSAHTEHEPLTSIPSVFAYEPRWVVGFQPDTYVDVTDVIETKHRAVMHLKSLRQWLKDESGVDITEACEIVSAYRGLQAGVEFAEAYVSTPGFGSSGTTRVLP